MEIEDRDGGDVEMMEDKQGLQQTDIMSNKRMHLSRTVS
jgi:hypothetical protein